MLSTCGSEGTLSSILYRHEDSLGIQVHVVTVTSDTSMTWLLRGLHPGGADLGGSETTQVLSAGNAYWVRGSIALGKGRREWGCGEYRGVGSGAGLIKTSNSRAQEHQW